MKKNLDFTILQIGDYTIQLTSIIKLSAFILLVIGLLFLLKKGIYKTQRISEAKKHSVFSLIKYFVLILASIMGMKIIGFDLFVIIASSAILLVGIGFGLQNLFSDFISGIIILLDTSVKENDIIEVNEIICIVKEINLRTTTAITRDNKSIIIPNSELTKNRIINWTHNKNSSSFEVKVKVDYTSDVNQVMTVLNEVALSMKGIQKEPKPLVRLVDFGDYALDFSVVFCTEEVLIVENIKSELRVKIFNTFKEKNINIVFPTTGFTRVKPNET